MLVKIMAAEIRFIEVDSKYCKLAYGTDKFVIQQSLKQLQDHEIILQDGSALPFSRRYMDDVMQAFSVLK